MPTTFRSLLAALSRELPFVVTGIVAALFAWLVYQEVRLAREHAELQAIVLHRAETRVAVEGERCELIASIIAVLRPYNLAQARRFEVLEEECSATLQEARHEEELLRHGPPR
jgi:hypothetical protein